MRENDKGRGKKGRGVAEDTTSLEGLPSWVRAMLWRRSFRVYDGSGLAASQLDDIERAARAAPSVMGHGSGWVELVRDPEMVGRVVAAATSGVIGKANWWLKSARPSAFLLAYGDEGRSIRIGDRWMYNVDVALAGEAAVLAAAEREVGSCWMAAIDERSLRRSLDLPSGRRIVAAISLGRPRATGARSLAGMWDRLANRLVSSRRKPMHEIHFLEDVRSDRRLPSVALDSVPTKADGGAVLHLVEGLVPSAHVAGDPVPDDLLAWMVESVRQAPSADNSQIWRLLLVREQARIRRIIEASCGRGHEDLRPLLDSRPGALVVAAASRFFISHRTAEQPFYLIDVPIALLHLLIAAKSFGLSFNVVWDFDYQGVAEVTGLADHHIVALVLLGRGSDDGQEEPWVQLGRG